MRWVFWGCRFLIFAFFLSFALKNTDKVTIRFFFDTAWDLPLIIAVLVFFVAGAMMGVIAMLSRIYRQRREITKLKKELVSFEKQIAQNAQESSKLIDTDHANDLTVLPPAV